MVMIQDEESVTVSCSDHPPQAWYSEPCMLGIDEAGRGPVLGPMVYAAAFCPCSTDLTSKAFADSKTLTEARREALLAQLQADPGIGFRAESLSAAFISGRMLARDRHSLNELANDSTARLIAGVVAAGVNLTHAYIDTVGDADKHRSRLLAQFPAIHFTVCPKADSLYPIVSAASIVAKVTRDRQLSAYTCPEGPSSRDREYGCGYPGDAVTKSWLESNLHRVFGFPSLVRFSWATCTPLLEAAAAVPVAWECEADDGAEGQQTLGWRAGAKRKAAGPRHAFFHMRRLAPVGGGTFVRGASLHA
ncbi:hypothetical protein ACKKBG_A30990 [Auxenochlorella protothecoides x Auxenochlorella symbiontica]